MTTIIGYPIKVFGVLTFMGKGTISVNGLPRDCVVTTSRELAKTLGATGARLSPSTVDKLARLARAPATWAPGG